MIHTLTMLLIILGLTFLYNPQAGMGVVYVNNHTGNGVILIDPSTNTMTVYEAKPIRVEKMNTGFETWLNNFMKSDPSNLRSVIQPLAEELPKSRF